MSSYNVATRYANALMELASEKDILNQVADDMQIVFNGIASSKELRTILKSPVIRPEKKEAILNDIFKDKVGDETNSFIQFIVKKNREDIIYDILKRFKELYNIKINRVEAHIKSFVELTEAQKEQLQNSLEEFTKKEVMPFYSIDESLIGGFVVKINDTVLDSSIKQQLDRLRKKLFEQNDIILN
ncbi:ATP synthase delta chain [hydrothermal vent metagenome]|uniref:ATP synthase delta chain n=1 Tax=hydrothermal vent metagenome TaxID=652676 RepID=A0A3B1C395_9ZZZZ